MIERLLLAVGLAAFVFLGGIYVGWYKLPPARQIEMGREAARDWRQHWRSYVGLEPTKFLHPPADPGGGMVTMMPEAAQPGVTMLAGLFGDDVGVMLASVDGRILHRWPTRFSEIWPDAPHLDPEEIPFNDWDALIHGTVLYPNGDVVFNLEYMGLTRLDRCGRVVWRLPYRTHHAVTIDEHGKLWVTGLKPLHRTADPRFPGLAPPFREDTVLQVSPDDGRILREISLLEVLHSSRYEGALYANGLPAPDPRKLQILDPLHSNHVEILPAALAEAFPLFAAGDILVSLRHIDAVMVIDGKSEKVKWSMTGPWVRQHEPHFLPNGQIAVFDNRITENAEPWAEGRPRWASRILTVDPRTSRVSVLFEGTREQPFFTEKMGKHQYLPNGNILVTEPHSGRAFEITPSGKFVWTFINQFDGEQVAKLAQATRYPADYAAFAAQACPTDGAATASAR